MSYLFKHIKTGNYYQILSDDARIEKNGIKSTRVTVYKSISHEHVWVRPSIEFSKKFKECILDSDYKNRPNPEGWIPPSSVPVHIVSAACQLKVGNRCGDEKDIIISSPRHQDITMRNYLNQIQFIDEFSMPETIEGFIDQFGRFWNRKEAWVIVDIHKQPLVDRGLRQTAEILYSEDLY